MSRILNFSFYKLSFCIRHWGCK